MPEANFTNPTSSLSVWKLLYWRRKNLKGEEIMLPGFIMWLLGIPLGVIILLWLFGVLG